MRLPFYIYTMKQFFFLFIISVFAACMGKTKSVNTDTLTTVSSQIIAEKTADSVEVLYYRKPFTDKERYTRFFSSLVTKDKMFIQSLQALLRLPGVKEDSLRACMSEGKINIPLKGDAYQVVYFSREAKPCNYFYVIREGQFFYYLLDDSLLGKLNELEKQAKAQ